MNGCSSSVVGREFRKVWAGIGVAIAIFVLAGCSVESRKARHLQRGDTYFAASNFDRAEIEFLNVLRLDPKSADAIGKIGIIYYEQGRLGRALPYLVRAQELDPANLVTRAKLAALLLSVGNRVQAADQASFILERKPDDAEALVMLAEATATPDAIATLQARLDEMPAALANGSAVWVAKGILSAKMGSISDARTAFLKALEIDPNSVPALSAMAAVHVASRESAKADLAYARAAALSGPRSPRSLQYARFKAQSGDFASARRILEGVLEAAPDYIPAVLRLVDLTAGEGKVEQARKILLPVMTREPIHPEGLLLSSRLWQSQRDYSKALTEIELLLRMYPKSPEAHVEEARIHLAKADPSRAMESLRLALDSNSLFKDAVVLLARIQVSQGNAAVAAAALHTYLKQDSSSPEAYIVLAEAYRAQRKFQPALDAVLELENVIPGQESVALLRGEILKELKRPADARAAFDEALIRNPNSVRALELLSDLDGEERQFDRARVRIETALAKRPEAADLYLLAGKLALVRGDRSGAESNLRKAVELNANLSLGYMLLARLYIDSKDSVRALENLRVIVQRNSRDTGAWMLLASLQEEGGDFPAARKSYEDLLAITPDFVPGLNNLACHLLEHSAEWDRATDLARKARELAPGDPVVADTLGWILYRKKDYIMALPSLRESVAKSPHVAAGHYRVARTLYMIGDEQAALESFKTAQEKGLEGKDAVDSKEKVGILQIQSGSVDAVSQSKLETRILKEPSDPAALLRLAEVYTKQGDAAKAAQARLKAWTANPQNGRVALAMAQLEVAKGDLPKAFEFARNARRILPEDGEILSMLGQLAYRTGDFVWSRTLLYDAFRKRPNDAAVAYHFGNVKYSLGEVSGARDLFVRATTPTSNEDLKERIQLIDAVEKSSVDFAMQTLARRRLAAKPDDVPSLMVLALIGAPTEARRHLETALTALPLFMPAKRALALLLFNEGPENDRRVVELATQIRESYRDDPALTRVFALSLARVGDYTGAAALLESTSVKYPQDSLVWYYLGVSRVKSNQADAGRRALEKALLLGLNNELAKEAIFMLAVLTTAPSKGSK